MNRSKILKATIVLIVVGLTAACGHQQDSSSRLQQSEIQTIENDGLHADSNYYTGEGTCEEITRNLNQLNEELLEEFRFSFDCKQIKERKVTFFKHITEPGEVSARLSSSYLDELKNCESLRSGAVLSVALKSNFRKNQADGWQSFDYMLTLLKHNGIEPVYLRGTSTVIPVISGINLPVCH